MIAAHSLRLRYMLCVCVGKGVVDVVKPRGEQKSVSVFEFEVIEKPIGIAFIDLVERKELELRESTAKIIRSTPSLTNRAMV